jgi:hypothetical protein
MSIDEPPDGGDEVEEWLGVVRYQGELYLVKGILAELILDYLAWDPAFSEDDGVAEFRNGLLTVTDENAPQFLQALAARRLAPAEVAALLRPTTPELLVFMDFDARRYIHSYYDLPLEKYVPKGWRGHLGDPRHELERHIPHG